MDDLDQRADELTALCKAMGLSPTRANLEKALETFLEMVECLESKSLPLTASNLSKAYMIVTKNSDAQGAKGCGTPRVHFTRSAGRLHLKENCRNES